MEVDRFRVKGFQSTAYGIRGENIVTKVPQNETHYGLV